MDDSLADILDGALDDFEDLTTSRTAQKAASISTPTPSQPSPAVTPSPSITSQPISSVVVTEVADAASTEITPASATCIQDPQGSTSHKTPAFDPLNKQRKPRKPTDSKRTAMPASAEASTSGHKLPPELEQLAADLAKLISETQPSEGGAAGPSTSAPASSASRTSQPAPRMMASTTASLAALAEVRQQAVEAQGQLPSPSGGGMFGGLLPDMENLKDPHMNVIVDSIMQHLLSKEVLYQPMKDIRDCYPPWLEKNQNAIPAEDLERYKKQFGFIQEICRMYETDPSNYSSLVSLMQQMQACGDPPEDIVREMSAGLDHTPPTEGGHGDEPPIDLQQLQQEINKCPMQ